jgi:hypothetical protein
MKKNSCSGTKITSQKVKNFTGDRLEAYHKTAGLKQSLDNKGKSLVSLAAQSYSMSKVFEDQKKVDKKLTKQKLCACFSTFVYF